MSIAVVMSAYRKDRYADFVKALESILSQTARDLRVLLAFDGPVSADIARYCADRRDPRLVVLHRNRNAGLAATLNQLLDVALAFDDVEYVARMDADDISESQRFARQAEFLTSHPEVGVVGTWCLEIDERDRPIALKTLPERHEQLARLAFFRSPMIHSSVMLRASVLRSGYRYSRQRYLTEDYDLWVRLLGDGVRFHNLQEPLQRFRINRAFYRRRGGARTAAAESRIKGAYARAFGRAMLYPLALFPFVVRTLPPAAMRLAYSAARPGLRAARAD